MKSEVISLANSLRKSMSRKEAMITAWAVVKVKAAMQSGSCKFTFVKDGGELREAEGTLVGSGIQFPIKTSKIGNITFTYFDTEKQAIRSFRVDRFISNAA